MTAGIKRSLHTVFLCVFIFGIFWNVDRPVFARQPVQAGAASISILDRNGDLAAAITDGDQIQLRLSYENQTGEAVSVQFALDDLVVANCSISSGEESCTSEPLLSLGWYWDSSSTAAPQRSVIAWVGGEEVAAASLQIKPRPVVMVHGLVSNWQAWSTYLGSGGYLNSVGIKGFAVGDGQAQGEMNTGNLADPAGRTNTIRQNAEILGSYIAQVKQATGAEMVDLLVHSMGGLISRAYIGQIMQERDVAQLIMLGSPMAGTECANLPASLGLYLPATLEIRPSYAIGIFNQQVTQRHGIIFYALAGNLIQDAFRSPCTGVPSDIAVSQYSVDAIPLISSTMPVLHTELNTSQEVFNSYVFPLLSQNPAQFVQASNLTNPNQTGQDLQFSRLYTGHLDPGETEEFVIPIEEGVTVASFALFDTSRSLESRVRGASGNEIELTADKHGLVVVDDPSALFYLGYGFNEPKPGQWRVELLATHDTPQGGADYALTAYMVGGMILNASAAPLLPQVGDPVTIKAAVSSNGQPVVMESARALVWQPDGQRIALELGVDGSQAEITFEPDQEGIYGIDLLTSVESTLGTIERSAFLSVETQPAAPPTRLSILIIGLVVGGIVFVLSAAVVSIVKRGIKRRQHR